jgi:hypothetical protein
LTSVLLVFLHVNILEDHEFEAFLYVFDQVFVGLYELVMVLEIEFLFGVNERIYVFGNLLFGTGWKIGSACCEL